MGSGNKLQQKKGSWSLGERERYTCLETKERFRHALEGMRREREREGGREGGREGEKEGSRESYRCSP